MSKKSLIWLTALSLAVHLSACSSNEEKTDVEGADVEAMSETAHDGDSALSSDSLPEEALGDQAAAPTEGEGLSLDDAPAATDTSAENPTVEPGADQPPMTVAGDTGSAEASGVMDSPPPSSTDSTLDPMTASNETPEEKPVEEKPKVSVPLQKVASSPWKVGKTWYNGVYFARPGDTLASISQSIYGEDRTASLKKGNPTYNSREPKPGDKVYYSSPKRPDDGQQMMTFNEEAGLAPEVYTAKAGDNIRKISKELLGYDNAWKEVWASNANVDSKGALEEGTQLRYWRGTAAAAAPTQTANAEQPPLPEPTMNNMPPEENMQQAHADLPPPPPMPEQAAADLPPPPPPMPEQAMNELPPPPPPMEMAPPPPPPPPPVAQAHKDKSGEQEATGMNEDSVMALGAAAIAAAGIAALLVARRRRKQKEMEASQIGDSTQVG